jgi:HSP20 family protein
MPKDSADKSRREDESDSTAIALPGLGFPSLFEDFTRPFDEFMQPYVADSTKSLWTEAAGREPRIDIQDRGDHFILTAELPGFEKKEVEVRLTSDSLELKAERQSARESKGAEGAQRLVSRSYFYRQLPLPDQVVVEKVNGTMKNGILELKLPKREQKPRESSRRVDLK